MDSLGINCISFFFQQNMRNPSEFGDNLPVFEDKITDIAHTAKDCYALLIASHMESWQVQSLWAIM
tara:strand:+ start:531 stop:728 length:198 start_codon:yes stop_codon:yes gene_type:complete